MSKGYLQASGEPHAFEFVGPAPAGSLSSPGEDMAHFMIAHLQNGEYNGNRILRAETAEMMHNSPLTLLPPLNRMELGFFETNINGREVIGTWATLRTFTRRCICSSRREPASTCHSTAWAKKAPRAACAARCSPISPIATFLATRKTFGSTTRRPPSMPP